MPNRALLRTTMAMVEASDQHDNQWFAWRRKDQPETETYCFATFTVLNVWPAAEIIWNLEVQGDQYGMAVRLPDGLGTHEIEKLATRLLEVDNEELFVAWKSKADLREMVDELAPV